jgi:hypothetical protein
MAILKCERCLGKYDTAVQEKCICLPRAKEVKTEVKVEVKIPKSR